MKRKTQPEIDSKTRQLVGEVLQLRYWQHLINEELKQNRFSIPVHMAFGHEAIAVAISNIMGPEDQLVLSHRNIEYNLARGRSLEPIYQEYLLSSDGAAKGKLGSMNLANPQWGVVYSSSILSNNMPVACGLALGKGVLNQSGIVIVLAGDGSEEEGPFYEGLVFSKSHGLPLMVVIENNDQSMSSSVADRRCPISMNTMCEAIGIPYFELRGNDVCEYHDLLGRVRQTVLGHEPVCVEVYVKAFNNHAGPTPGWATDPKNISLDGGLVVERNLCDPVFVLEQNFPTSMLAELTKEIMEKPGEGPMA